MVRLSKSKRDALKASGEWKAHTESARSLSYAAGAAEFARLSNEAQANLGLDDDDEFEPIFSPRSVPFYPDVFSVEEVYYAVEMETSAVEAAHFHRPADYNVDVTTEQAASFFLAMAAKASETASLSGPSSFEVPTVVVTDTMARLLDTLGEFQDGRFHHEFADLNSFVKACLRSAIAVFEGSSIVDALSLFKAPTSMSDANFKFNVAVRLSPWLNSRGYHEVTVECLARSIFSGFVPDEVTYAPPRFVDDLDEVVRLLFTEVQTLEEFREIVSGPVLSPIFDEIGFHRNGWSYDEMSLADACRIASGIAATLTPVHKDGDGPSLYLPYSQESEGSVSQLVYPRSGNTFLVPKSVPPQDRADVIAAQKACRFRVFSPSYEAIGNQWVKVFFPPLDIGVHDLEDFPEWNQV
jgi:hypothetical protein